MPTFLFKEKYGQRKVGYFAMKRVTMMPTAIIDENTRFYIPEDSLFRAQKQYGSDDSVLTVIIGTLAMIAFLLFSSERASPGLTVFMILFSDDDPL